MNLIEMSVTAGVMIIAVVIVRALTINRLPKKTFLALWAVVLCRLLLPMALSSPLSFYNAVPAARGARLPAAGWLPVLPVAAGGEPAARAAVPLLPALWFLGAAALAIFFLISYARCRREFRQALPVENEFVRQWLAERSLRRGVRLGQSERISAPLTYGLFRPVILMPKNTDWSNESQLAYVLSHELCHIRRLDTLWKLILTAALCLHWFNPLVWAMYVLANRDLELSCDESVVHSFGEDSKRAYALTLIGMEERRSMLTPLCNNFSKNAIEERIRALMSQKRVTAVAILAALVIVAGVTVVFATSASTAGSPAPTPGAAPSPTQAADPSSAQADASNVPFVYKGMDHSGMVQEAMGGLGWNDDGEYEEKPDPETGHYYTKKQYDLVAAFRTEGYEKMSIAEFNRAVNAIFQTDGDYEGSFEEAYEKLIRDLPLDDPLASFVYYTIDASANEYNTRLSEVYSGKRVDPTLDSQASRTEKANVFGDEVEVGWASVDYSVSYRILDQDRLTVGERDQFLLEIVKGMQAWLDGLDLRSQTDEETMLKAAQAELERLGKAGTTAHIEYTGGTAEDCYWDFYRS